MAGNLHFLRPEWLLLLPLTLAATLLWWRQAPRRTQWSRICDPELLPHLLATAPAETRSRAPIAVGLLAVLLPLAMAGPAWQRLPQPVFEVPHDVVLVMDLSQSMAATDVRPTRLDRARFAAHDLLDAQHEGQTGLVAFAGSAFAVVPLTTDRRTVAHLLDSLDTTLMPKQGSRIDTGLRQAGELLANAGSHRGTVVVLTDSPADGSAQDAAAELNRSGYRVDVIGVGTAAGAPVPLPAGGWATDSGGVALARLDADSLRGLATAGGGRYYPLARHADLGSALQPVVAEAAANSRAADLNADQWRDEGFWLVLLALPLVAGGFRRGALLSALLILPLLQPQPAYAWDWQSLWRNADQRGQERMAEDPAAAAGIFDDPQWSASAHYRAGEYQQAADLFGQADTAQSHYNRGNALARAGDLQAALDAYDAALAKAPDFADAQDNRDLVQKLLDQQQDQQQNDQQKQQQSDQQDKSQQQDQRNQSQNGDSDSESQNGNGQNDQQSQQSGGDDQAGQQSQDANASDKNGDPQQSGTEDGQPGEQPEQQPSTAQPTGDDTQDPDANSATAQAAETQPSDEATQAMEQWLRRVPDDPGGLLREKFRRQQQRRQPTSNESNPW